MSCCLSFRSRRNTLLCLVALFLAATGTLLFTGCGPEHDGPAVTLQLSITDRGFPHIFYSAGPMRSYRYSSNLYKYEASLGPVGKESSVTLEGSLTWKDAAKERAVVSFHLKNTEPVVVELTGMHLNNPNASEKEAVFRQQFQPGAHEFNQELLVIFTFSRE